MAGPKFPYSPKRGALKGQTFHSQSEYNAALKAAKTGVNVPDEAPKRQAPIPKYSKAMVGALVEMVSGVLGFLPVYRASPITDDERKWLVDDWYDFGKQNRWFAQLVASMMTVNIYGRLLASNIGVFGKAWAEHPEAVPDVLRPVVLTAVPLAYITRSALSAEVLEEDALATGGAPDTLRSNGIGQDVPSEETLSSTSPYSYAGDQAR